MNTIITVEEFKKFCPSSTLSSEQIQIYCELMTEYIHELAGVSLEEGEHTEILRGTGQDTLFLKKRPVSSIISLKSNMDTTFDDIYINEYKTGIKRLYGIFYKGQDIYDNIASVTSKSERIEITYVGGYKYGPDGNVPKLLKYALCGLINSFSDSTDSFEGKLKSYRRDDVAYEFKSFTERNVEFMNILFRYI